MMVTMPFNELEELRQENLRLKNELHYANNALAMLKFKGINQVNYTPNDLKVISRNPPSVAVRNFYNNEGESTIEWYKINKDKRITTTKGVSFTLY